MSRRALFFVGVMALVAFVAFSSTSISYAEPQRQPDRSGSPMDLVNADNSLRAMHGLAPYNISTILMGTAQGQADFLAATGSMTHSGPDLLAGDLSLGGFRSENITGGAESMSAQAAVDSWTRDSLHLTTMISPDLTEIGAGVSVNSGKVYYVIDCARPTNSGAPQAAATSLGGGSAVPTRDPNVGVVIPVALSTPNANGDVIHEVKAGQSLWQIAIAYKVKIDEIRRLNGLSGNDIYPGNKLLIKKGVVAAAASPTDASLPAATITSTSLPVLTATYSLPLASTPVALATSASPNNSMIMKVTMGVIALALLGGGILAWLEGAKKK